MKPFIFCSLLLSLLAVRGETPSAKNLPDAAAVSSTDLTSYKTEDALWQHLGELSGKLENLHRGDEELAKSLTVQVMATTKAYLAQYPKGPHVGEVKMDRIQAGGLMIQLGQDGAPTKEEMEKNVEDLATDANVPEKNRAQVRAMQIGESIQKAVQGGSPADWIVVDAKFADFQKQFGPTFSIDGKKPILSQLRHEEIMMLKSAGDTDRVAALIKKLKDDPNTAAIAKEEQAVLDRVANLQKEPLALKFKAVDGTDVDVSKLRGKVVLIDFWATWCGPCVQEMPNVIDAYKKYHDKGFEIVGISLDQDKDKLLDFTKENGMPWPQYFDGAGFDNAIASSYGIDSIPRMWLVNKKGMVVDAAVTENLDGQIQDLLKAP